jgi:CRISPR-associated protein Cmr1
MTALYGGGAEAGQNDAEDPFRIPSIRGQLRFWWRATIGGRYQDEGRLREAEAAIWGSTEQASRVRLRMLYADRGSERPAAGLGPDGRWQKEQPDYALFPAQEDRKHIGRLHFGGRFRLEIAAEEGVLPDVDAALWAWVTFGGIGGRTRRGAGSLFCAPYAYTWKAEVIEGNGSPRGWPTLEGGTAVMGSRKYPWAKCWEECVNLLRDFRQRRSRPRGRSTWPEPDEIRRLRDEYAPQHSPVHKERGFPRAALGLPIIFHFKTDGDPQPNTLNVLADDDKEARMASPVILKPWAVSATEAIPLMVVLNAPEAGSLVLRQSKPKAPDKHEGEDFPRGNRDELFRSLIQEAEEKWDGRKLAL